MARVRTVAVVAAVTLLSAACRLAPHTVLSVPSPHGDGVAYVRESPSIDPPNQTLWVAFNGTPPQRVEHLGEDTHWCDRIVWSPDERASDALRGHFTTPAGPSRRTRS